MSRDGPGRRRPWRPGRRRAPRREPWSRPPTAEAALDAPVPAPAPVADADAEAVVAARAGADRGERGSAEREAGDQRAERDPQRAGGVPPGPGPPVVATPGADPARPRVPGVTGGADAATARCSPSLPFLRTVARRARVPTTAPPPAHRPARLVRARAPAAVARAVLQPFTRPFPPLSRRPFPPLAHRSRSRPPVIDTARGPHRSRRLPQRPGAAIRHTLRAAVVRAPLARGAELSGQPLSPGARPCARRRAACRAPGCGLAAAFLSAAFAAHACDLCRCTRPAWRAAKRPAGMPASRAVHALRRIARRRPRDPRRCGQYLDSSITQLFVGYGAAIGSRCSSTSVHPSLVQAARRRQELTRHRSGSAIWRRSRNTRCSRHDDEDENLVWRALGGVKFGTGDSDRLTEELDEGAEAAALPSTTATTTKARSAASTATISRSARARPISSSARRAFYRSGRWYGEARCAVCDPPHRRFRLPLRQRPAMGAVGRALSRARARPHGVAAVESFGRGQGLRRSRRRRADDTQSRVLFLGPQMGFTFGPRWSLELRADFRCTSEQLDPDHGRLARAGGARREVLARIALAAFSFQRHSSPLPLAGEG